MRPGLERFLRAVCTDTSLEVHIFTAGEEHYAAPLLDTLEELLHISLPRRHYRSACTVRNQYYMKNLAAIIARADGLARVVLVDNSSVSCALQGTGSVERLLCGGCRRRVQQARDDPCAGGDARE